MDDERRQAIALWRFGVLGPLVSARLEHGDRQQYFRSAADRVHEHPDDRLILPHYISSVKPDATVTAKLVRGHWGIENQQHWTLDMAFDEDRNRTRKSNGPDNFALLRRIALNLLKAETSTKRSIQRKRLTAGWDAQYLLRVLEAGAQQKPEPSAR